MFTKAILKESWAVQEVMEDSRIEGRAEGEAKGRTEEARKLLVRSLARRFPGLESLPELDAIQDATVLEDLLVEQIIGGSDRHATLNAIRRAAGE